MINLPNAYHN